MTDSAKALEDIVNWDRKTRNVSLNETEPVFLMFPRAAPVKMDPDSKGDRGRGKRET